MRTTTTTTSAGAATNVQNTAADLAACACHAYDAECALHTAHQSGVDAWINAAAAKLHQALTEYLAAAATSSPGTADQVLDGQQATA